MATATESDVRFYLPQTIQDVPSSADVTTALSKAQRKVGEYDLESDVIGDAEAIWAALTLLRHKYPMPEETSGPTGDETFTEAPQETLEKRFKRITNMGFRVL